MLKVKSSLITVSNFKSLHLEFIFLVWNGKKFIEKCLVVVKMVKGHLQYI